MTPEFILAVLVGSGVAVACFAAAFYVVVEALSNWKHR